jgi:hypothetical protein
MHKASSVNRLADIERMLVEGMTLDQIGKILGFTRQRAHQIVVRHGLSDALKRAVNERRAKRSDAAKVVSASNRLESKGKTAARNGMTLEKYLDAVRSGALQAYRVQRARAAIRGIAWEFKGFSDWWSVWEKSGKWDMRGRRLGQYVMSRLGDVGPYAEWNVCIILHSENIKQGHKNYINRLTSD